MIQFEIQSVKEFMSQLLIGTLFDSFYIKEVSLTTFNTFTIDGHIHKNFFTSEEWEEIGEPAYSTWEQLKPICYQLIKGKKTPLNFRIIFIASGQMVSHCLDKAKTNLTSQDINGLYLHISYENGKIICTTGISLSIFTMDKSLEHYWDQSIEKFVSTHLK